MFTARDFLACAASLLCYVAIVGLRYLPQVASPPRKHMRNLEKCARSIASAIKSCNGNRITQEAATSAARQLVIDSKPDELADNMVCWLNLSALNQELERHGLVKTDRAVPALIGAVKAELAKK